MVNDVLNFLRDLPVNAVLSASSVEQLGAALGAIFQHLLKLKNSKVRIYTDRTHTHAQND